MRDRLGPSRIGEVLDPLLLVGTLIATIGGSGLALAYDPARSTTAIGLVFFVLLFANIFLVSAYFISIGRQGLNRRFPLLGVGGAAAGCAGFAANVGLAVSRPLTPMIGVLGLAAGLALIGFDLRARRRRHRPT